MDQFRKDGYVYLITVEDKLNTKVGRSKHPEKRLKQLQIAIFNELKLHARIYSRDCHALERFLQKRLKEDEFHDRGEWFQFSNETVRKEKSFDIMKDAIEQGLVDSDCMDDGNSVANENNKTIDDCDDNDGHGMSTDCLLYTSPSPRD